MFKFWKNKDSDNKGGDQGIVVKKIIVNPMSPDYKVINLTANLVIPDQLDGKKILFIVSVDDIEAGTPTHKESVILKKGNFVYKYDLAKIGYDFESVTNCVALFIGKNGSKHEVCFKLPLLRNTKK